MDIFLVTLLLILAVFVNVAELIDSLPFNADVVLSGQFPLPVDRDVFYKLANGTDRNLKTFHGLVPCLVNKAGNTNVIAAVDEKANVRQLYLGPIKDNKPIMLNFDYPGDKKYVPMPQWVANLFGIKFNKSIPLTKLNPPGGKNPGQPPKP